MGKNKDFSCHNIGQKKKNQMYYSIFTSILKDELFCFLKYKNKGG